ncbi:hypothetical protein Q3G72_009058 [Acer saccharum]|nr:hypothetical protein Q3G72_009058 [Acer saccharum]
MEELALSKLNLITNLQEYVYNRLQFSYGWYFTFVQGFVYLCLIYLQGFTTKQMVNPWKTYVKLSAVLQRISCFSQLPCTAHVQIHQGIKSKIKHFKPKN